MCSGYHMNEVGLETIGEERVDFIVLDEAEGVR